MKFNLHKLRVSGIVSVCLGTALVCFVFKGDIFGVLDGQFVLECLVLHGKFSKVLALVMNKIGVIKNRTLFEFMVIQRWFSVDDLANQMWFVKGFFWVVTNHVDCSVASTLHIIVARSASHHLGDKRPHGLCQHCQPALIGIDHNIDFARRNLRNCTPLSLLAMMAIPDNH